MKLSSISLLVFLSLVIINCSKSTHVLSGESIALEFYTSDSSGKRINIFSPNSDIFFHVLMSNNSDSTINYYTVHSGPEFGVKIYQGDSLIGTSDDQKGYATVIVDRQLRAGHALEWSDSWLSNPAHTQPLPSGSYKAVVVSYINFYYLARELTADTLGFVIR
ncbi:MAG: hypothetical protein Kow00108_26720 [Calditrichia bacterium]